MANAFKRRIRYRTTSTSTIPAGAWVASTGNNGNDGSFGSPWLTIAYAITQQASWPSRTLNIVGNGAVYAETIDDALVSGSSGNPYIVRGYYSGSARPILRPAGGNNRVIYTYQNTDLTFRGLACDGVNVSFDCIKIEDADRITVDNCEVYNETVSQGILVSTGSTFVTIQNCDVHNNGTDNFTHGIYISQCTDAVVENNHCYSNAGWGIQVYAEVANVNDRVIVRNNRCHDNGTGYASAAGIVLAASADAQIYNNTCWDNPGPGIQLQFGSARTDAHVYYNTCYSNGDTGILIGANSSNTLVKNNICYANGTNYSDAGTGTVHTNNLDDGTDPSFTNAASADFTLQAGSAALGIGADVGIYTDQAGNSRPVSSPDAGAFERA